VHDPDQVLLHRLLLPSFIPHIPSCLRPRAQHTVDHCPNDESTNIKDSKQVTVHKIRETGFEVTMPRKKSVGAIRRVLAMPPTNVYVPKVVCIICCLLTIHEHDSQSATDSTFYTYSIVSFFLLSPQKTKHLFLIYIPHKNPFSDKV